MAKKTKLTDSEIENLEHLVGNYGDVFHEGAHCVYGISGWFKAYIQSADFAALGNEKKAKALETYEHLHFVLETLEDVNNELKERN